MEGISIRNAISGDIPYLMKMDHGYRSDHVWQMSVTQSKEEISIKFREVRLPRPMRVRYPRDPGLLADEWTHRSGFFVAERAGQPVGYIALVDGPSPNSIWATDLVVSHAERRQGVGTKLLHAGIRWGNERQVQRLCLEMQSKNYPAIALARKSGFDFIGYSDRYFPDEDIALFFGLELS